MRTYINLQAVLVEIGELTQENTFLGRVSTGCGIGPIKPSRRSTLNIYPEKSVPVFLRAVNSSPGAA